MLAVLSAFPHRSERSSKTRLLPHRGVGDVIARYANESESVRDPCARSIKERNGATGFVCGGAPGPRRWFEPTVKQAKIVDFTGTTSRIPSLPGSRWSGWTCGRFRS